MRKKQIYQLSALVAMSIIIIGCTNSKEAKPTVATPITTSVASQSTSSVAELKNAGVGTIALKGKTNYSQNQSIQFAVDTMGKTGYLYIVYVDNNGGATLLYPNAKSPLTELNGKYIFPRDFGIKKINAEKDCNGCKEEKTTVYAILSKDPISDIKSITASHLGATSSMSKGLSMIEGGETTQSSNMDIGKIEFFVK
jgi:hypothetical protein